MEINTKWLIGIGAALLLISGCALFAITHRDTQAVTVARIAWELKINIEEFRVVRQDSWDLPPDARNVETKYEYHHSYQYVSGSHQSCAGTGSKRTCRTVLDYSSRSVYRDKYYYDVDRWQVARIPTTSGDDHAIHWPDVSDLREPHGPTPQIGDERAGMRSSRFLVVFIDGSGKEYPVDMTESLWREFSPGSKAHLELNIFGTVIAVRP